MAWREFRVSVSDHCQRFGIALVLRSRRDEWIIALLRLLHLRASTKRASPCERYWTRDFVKTSTTSSPVWAVSHVYMPPQQRDYG